MTKHRRKYYRVEVCFYPRCGYLCAGRTPVACLDFWSDNFVLPPWDECARLWMVFAKFPFRQGRRIFVSELGDGWGMYDDSWLVLPEAVDLLRGFDLLNREFWVGMEYIEGRREP